MLYMYFPRCVCITMTQCQKVISVCRVLYHKLPVGTWLDRLPGLSLIALSPRVILQRWAVIIISPSVIISVLLPFIITPPHFFRFLFYIHSYPWLLLFPGFNPFLSHNTRHLRPRG
ncbi:uncharacterized protein EURHEDRAFT_138489 [Aspergillus ruber CBS 135680]|uniref:Uncharacterized protein n=1 Tax=Aspergillus ruber (strain CBS 135680) TaxID=1388766 RepID=A0A017SBN4_ASPRC|nr:uncharacterized protein EURHEDRAFT_138489 [Aspergillus ruber CBS 135680]EYE93595.1 hypothetical protein EURHEDRAFT_138489 [Aspergillus ruber CBS 135680]